MTPADQPADDQQSPAPASGGTSASKVRKPQKSAREIELEIKNAELEDERDTLRKQNGELEKFAKSLGAGKAGKKAGQDTGKEPAKGSGWDWEGFANSL